MRLLKSRIPRPSSESGYSLAEMLVVVAIVGIISLVSIPNFMSMYRMSKVKASLRQFTSDVRAVRARAVSRNLRQKITFVTGGEGKRSYNVYEFRDTSSPADGTPDEWVKFDLPNQRLCDDDPNFVCLDETVYFNSTTFEDLDEDADADPDIVFRGGNGIIDPIPPDGGEVVLRTVSEIPINQYTLDLNLTGRVKVTESSF